MLRASATSRRHALEIGEQVLAGADTGYALDDTQHLIVLEAIGGPERRSRRGPRCEYDKMAVNKIAVNHEEQNPP